MSTATRSGASIRQSPVIDEPPVRPQRVAVVTGDTLGKRLSGPGIRALELARVLSTDHEVRLVSTVAADLEVAGVETGTAITAAEVKDLASWCDILVFQGLLLVNHPWLVESSSTMVVDLYDPFHLEFLEQGRALPIEERNRQLLRIVAAVNQQLERGDYFLCASSKQRDFWLGQLTAVGRINVHTYERDKSLASLIGVVPFGIKSSLPKKNRAVLRGVVDGIGPHDRVLLWGGGLYPWLDPHTLVRAVDRLRSSVPDVRLVFLAGRHPNPDIGVMPTAGEVRTLAAELELDRHVFFIDDWVEYTDRHNYLLEADIGVSTHLHHIETDFSFRTRVLDYVWARLPIVTTSGDAMAELVLREHVGSVVPPGDVEALASALASLLSGPDDALSSCSQRLADLAPSFHWEEVAAPLVRYCRRPSRAPDLVRRTEEPMHGAGDPSLRPRIKRAAHLVRQSLHDDGTLTTVWRAAKKLRARVRLSGGRIAPQR